AERGVEEAAALFGAAGREHVVRRREHDDGRLAHEVGQALQRRPVEEHPLPLPRHEPHLPAPRRPPCSLERTLHLEERTAAPDDVLIRGREEALGEAEVVGGLQHVRLPGAVGPVEEVHLRAEFERRLFVRAEGGETERAKTHGQQRERGRGSTGGGGRGSPAAGARKSPAARESSRAGCASEPWTARRSVPPPNEGRWCGGRLFTAAAAAAASAVAAVLLVVGFVRVVAGG